MMFSKQSFLRGLHIVIVTKRLRRANLAEKKEGSRLRLVVRVLRQDNSRDGGGTGTGSSSPYFVPKRERKIGFISVRAGNEALNFQMRASHWDKESFRPILRD